MENYHIITFPGQSLSKTLEDATDLSRDRLILDRKGYFRALLLWINIALTTDFLRNLRELMSDTVSFFYKLVAHK
jgi:hypothetical protein